MEEKEQKIALNPGITFNDIVVTGFSGGGGKTYFSKKIVSCESSFKLTISDTTRPMRPGEKDNVDYNFISSPEEFLRKIAQGEYLEFNQAGPEIFYGSTVTEYQHIKASNNSAVFEIDIFGALQLYKKLGENLCIIFLHTTDDTRLRLMDLRGDMTEDQKKSRIKRVNEIEMPLFEKSKLIFKKIYTDYSEKCDALLMAHDVINLAARRLNWNK